MTARREGSVLTKKLEPIGAPLAVISLWGKFGELHACGGTFPNMVPPNASAKSFCFRTKIEKEGLPRGNTPPWVQEVRGSNPRAPTLSPSKRTSGAAPFRRRAASLKRECEFLAAPFGTCEASRRDSALGVEPRADLLRRWEPLLRYARAKVHAGQLGLALDLLHIEFMYCFLRSQPAFEVSPPYEMRERCVAKRGLMPWRADRSR
jgi:hypothetical protein